MREALLFGGLDWLGEEADRLAAAGEEARALGLLDDADRLGLLAVPGSATHRVSIARAQVGMQVGASIPAEAQARGLAERAGQMGEWALAAEAWHIVALTRRQLRDVDGSLEASGHSLALLSRVSPPSALTRAVRWQYRLTRAISLSEKALRAARLPPYLRAADQVPPTWRVATRELRALVEEAALAGRERDHAHANLRLAAHELGRWDVRDEVWEVVAAAQAGAAALSIAAQVILSRVLATRRLLRDGDPSARQRLLAVREEDRRRGYFHQVAIIDRSLALYRGPR